MKDKIYTEIICKGFCSHYKEGKEGLLCNGYVFLRNNFTSFELKTMLQNIAADLQKDREMVCRFAALPQYRTKDKKLINLLCRKCDFFIDGCDYSDNQSGPPCGGYLIVRLTRKMHL